MKLKMKGRRLDTVEDIQAEPRNPRHSDRKGLPGSVPKIEERWELCLHAGGNYFEGDGGRQA
jgi:hypothetical protein